MPSPAPARATASAAANGSSKGKAKSSGAKSNTAPQADPYTDPKTGLPTWGRVLIAGGTDWPLLGRKHRAQAASAAAAGASSASGSGSANPLSMPVHDVPGPSILRALSNVRIAAVRTSGVACHAVLLSTEGQAYVLGRNDHAQCGVPPDAGSASALYTPLRLSRRRHFAPPLPRVSESSGSGSGSGGKSARSGRIVEAACGRSHTLLVTASGELYAAGSCASAQTGFFADAPPAAASGGVLPRFTRVSDAPWMRAGAGGSAVVDPVVQAAAGASFSLALTASGKVYAFGSAEHGQLGNGKTGEHLVAGARALGYATHARPLQVTGGGMGDKKIVQIAAGAQHAVARSEDGYVFVWGFGGYGRLGIGSADDQLTPQIVHQFARDLEKLRAVSIAAGPTCTAIIDGMRTFHIAGKWKTSGDGGLGQGYMTYKYLTDLLGQKVHRAALGGVTLFVVSDETDPALQGAHEPTLNICWGQNASHGELALGADKPRSATKPVRCGPLDGLALLDIAAGQHTTFFLARSQGDAYSNLPRFPEMIETLQDCIVCGQNDEETNARQGDVLECEKCDRPYHLRCLAPPLDEVPEGEWHCPRCVCEGERAGQDSDSEPDAEDSDADAAGEPDVSLQKPSGTSTGKKRRGGSEEAAPSKAARPAAKKKRA